jgi:hypothetical protein
MALGWGMELGRVGWLSKIKIASEAITIAKIRST